MRDWLAARPPGSYKIKEIANDTKFSEATLLGAIRNWRNKSFFDYAGRGLVRLRDPNEMGPRPPYILTDRRTTSRPQIQKPVEHTEKPAEVSTPPAAHQEVLVDPSSVPLPTPAVQQEIPDRKHLPADIDIKVTWEEKLLSKFPEFDPLWPEPIKTKWFECFERFMSFE
jgi:hypothetical protein